MGRRHSQCTNLDSKSKEEVMPVYEYNCSGSCEGIVVKTRGIREEDPGYSCDTCNQPLIRVYSNVGAVFNGSGFYSTDNRKK
jgi:putative FmdB family regulatory protein